MASILRLHMIDPIHHLNRWTEVIHIYLREGVNGIMGRGLLTPSKNWESSRELFSNLYSANQLSNLLLTSIKLKIHLWTTDPLHPQAHPTTSHRFSSRFEKTHHLLSLLVQSTLKNAPLKRYDLLWNILSENVQSTPTHMAHIWNGSRVSGIHKPPIPSPIICSLLSRMTLKQELLFFTLLCRLFHSNYICTTSSLS